MATSTLDQLISQSKQVTEDLLAVRRQAKTTIRSLEVDATRRRAADRLYLVLNDLDALRDGIHEAWIQATGLNDSKQQRTRAVRAALDNGQLKLISGDF